MAVAYEAVIGLEVHAQLLTESKLFSAAPTRFGAPANRQVSPVCVGLPGALPVPNGRAIEMAVQAGLALGCEIRLRSEFARKNYFYPDLAKGYQISQHDQPIAEHGSLRIETDGHERVVGVTRVHLEEDAAKNLHGAGRADRTLVDFNRAGVPLIEIVSEPDLRSAVEAEAYLRKLREILMFLGVNDGNLEEGSFRCDANVSLRPAGSTTLGTRAELKNINSFRFVRKALEFEIARQEALVAGGGEVARETRTWDEPRSRTVSMRSKEEAHDYRYFPDPDLPPIVLTERDTERARQTMPELPEDRRARWVEQLGLTAYDASVLCAHPEIAGFFEAAANALSGQGPEDIAAAGKRTANFMQAELLRYVRTEGLAARFPITSGELAELLSLVAGGRISGKIAKEVLTRVMATGMRPSEVVRSEGLEQVADEGAIEAIVRKVIADHPNQAGEYRAGKHSLLGFFVGQVMKASKGKANPKLANEALKRHLSE